MCQETQVYIYIKPDNFNEIDLKTRSLTILGGLSGWFNINLTDAKKIYSKVSTLLKEGGNSDIIPTNSINNTLKNDSILQKQFNKVILGVKNQSSINHIEFTSERIKPPVIERRNEKGQYLPRVIDSTIEIRIEYQSTVEKVKIKKINNKVVHRFNFNKHDVFNLLIFNMTETKKTYLVDFSINKNKVDVNDFKKSLSGPDSAIKFGVEGISESIINAKENKGASKYLWTAIEEGYYFVGICCDSTLFLFTCTKEALDKVKMRNRDRLKTTLIQKLEHDYEWQYQQITYNFQLRLSSSGSAIEEVIIDSRDRIY